MNQPTCKERVKDHLTGRIADLRLLWKLYQEDPEGSDENIGKMDEYGLCFDYVAPGTFKDQKRGYFRYQLSYGGPSDEFRIYTGPGFEVDRIEYWFLDWFDGAKITLSGKRLALLSEIFQSYFVDSETAQVKYQEALS